MGWFLGPLLAAFIVAWIGVGAVSQLTQSFGVQTTTFLGTFTAVFTGGSMKKKNKTVKKFRPQVMSLRKRVDSKLKLK